MLDSHLHVVDAGTAAAVDVTANPAGAWWSAVDASPQAVTARVLAAGVDGGVFVQAVAAHGFDSGVAVEAAAAAGRGWAAVAAIGDHSSDDPDCSTEGSVPLIPEGAAGLRIFSVPQPERTWLDGRRGIALIAECAAAGITPSVCCLPGELGALGRLAGAWPDTEIALDHIGFVDVLADRDAVTALAARPNIVAKLSYGVFERASGSPRSVVDSLLGAFGAERIAWGSDHPQVRDRSYAQLAAAGRAAVSHLPSSTAQAILHDNCARLWL